MCDSFYAVEKKKAFFGKNSDRVPEEPQCFCIIPPREPVKSTRISGGRELPVPDRGDGYALSRPSWMWGGEMGVNAHGLAIGNEAVFSRQPLEKEGILGMDILRLALQNERSPEEAIDFIIRVIGEYGQGGNGAYRGSLYYHNSFIICSATEGFVLETAGRRWALKKVRDIASISNAYTIGTDVDKGDTTTIELSSAGISWKKAVERKLFTFFSKGNIRQACTEGMLRDSFADSKGLTIGNIFSVLRSHNTFFPGVPGRKSMESICMHPGGFPDNATTASLAMQFGSSPASPSVLWFTGTSLPCLSLYKPVILAEGSFFPLVNSITYDEPPVEAKGMEAMQDYPAGPFSYWSEHRRLVSKLKPAFWTGKGCGRCKSIRGCSGICLQGEHPGGFFGQRDLLQQKMIEASDLWIRGKKSEALVLADKTEGAFKDLLLQSFGS